MSLKKQVKMAACGYRLMGTLIGACRRSSVIMHNRTQALKCAPTTGSKTQLMSTGAEAQESTQPELKLSDSCVKQLHKLGEDKEFLRILVEGGGCSGFQYKFEMDSEMTDDDRVFERDGAKVVVDDVSLEYIKGSTIDYHEELIRSAFSVIDNPGAEMGCSCGASFSFKL
ncbi:iron-sulfur cluster assembly 2 homolog, mitochondrial [Strongylocentrotus purpuratus]|uniref:Iron-sulfur cluster assembly 2 homolog, mitochondrial n=1 Tax=Strongylocentrotus purpuratus TaxID=7668 RepID=A0A7M7GJG5_STRPU|nr:iron-sulfur cluster assembly 2 homolog, mitochondrial [Strongylocentrotus purpuratus]